MYDVITYIFNFYFYFPEQMVLHVPHRRFMQRSNPLIMVFIIFSLR